MSYCIQASPYSKLFMREFHKQCEENPELVNKVFDFKVVVPRSAGAIILTHNVPVHTSKLLPKTKQKIDEHCPGELDSLVEWLTGGDDGMRSNETDIYGVVKLDLESDLSAAIVNLVTGINDSDSAPAKKDAEAEFKELTKRVKEQSKTAVKEARELADARVIRALKTTHRNLMKQYEIMKQEGKGVYMPSTAEAIGSFILKDELAKANEGKKQMLDRFSQIINETTVLS